MSIVGGIPLCNKMKWLHDVYTPPSCPASLSPPAEGCGYLWQASWITHVGLIPFILSVLSVKESEAGPSLAGVQHPHMQAQVSVFNKDYMWKYRRHRPRPTTSWEIPFPFHDLQFALIITACVKALNPCLTTRFLILFYLFRISHSPAAIMRQAKGYSKQNSSNCQPRTRLLSGRCQCHKSPQ